MRTLSLLALSLFPTLAAAQSLPHVRTRALERSRPFEATRVLSGLDAADSTGVIAVGDLDGDGDLDLVSGQSASGVAYPVGFYTWRNLGQLEFEQAGLRSIPVGFGSFDVANWVELADVTGDGQLDLVMDQKDLSMQLGPSGVLILHGNGDGTFGASSYIPVTGIVSYLTVGDADGDGTSEILTHSSTDTFDRFLDWRQWNGAGFSSLGSLDVTTAAVGRLEAIDYDADGDDDAMTVAFDGFHTMRFYETAADGTLSASTELELPPEVHNINSELFSGDLDGDGDEDGFFVMQAFSPDETFFLPIVQGPGGMALGTLQEIDEPAGIEDVGSRQLAFGDWDSDGDADLVTPLFTFFENDGSNLFTMTGRIYNGGISSTSSLTWMVDIDRDGELDALAERGVYRGTGTLPTRASQPDFDDAGGATGILVEDWDGDGDEDWVGTTRRYDNDGSGQFHLRHTLLPPSFFVQEVVGWGDFDGDGYRDLVVALYSQVDIFSPLVFEDMTLYGGLANGLYETTAVVPNTVEMPADQTNVPGADLDADGDLDLAVQGGYWENDGTGVFAPALVAAYEGKPLEALDVDADGDTDLLVARNGELRMLFNQGAGTFVVQLVHAYTVDTGWTFGDADGDGSLELFVWRQSADDLSIYTQAGGQFGPLPVVLEFTAPELSPIGIADVNGDGVDDLLACNHTPGTFTSYSSMRVWLGQGGLAFGTPRDWYHRSNFGMRFGDYDGDGDVDGLGTYMFENLEFDEPDSGALVQYQLSGGVLGSGGLRPVLGASGPLRYGSPTAALRISRGLGGAMGVLAVGTGRGVGPSAFPGVQSFVEPFLTSSPIVLGGAPGVADAGTLDIPLVVDRSLVGETFTFQVFLVDPGSAVGVSSSNGLELTFGRSAPRNENTGADPILR